MLFAIGTFLKFEQKDKNRVYGNRLGNSSSRTTTFFSRIWRRRKINSNPGVNKGFNKEEFVKNEFYFDKK